NVEYTTVHALKYRANDIHGNVAVLIVASSSMGNLVSQIAHMARGQETIAGADSHMVVHEAAGNAVIEGTSVRQLRERPDGTLDLRDVAEAVRDPDDPHNPVTGLVDIENTHSDSMAQPLSADYTAS